MHFALKKNTNSRLLIIKAVCRYDKMFIGAPNNPVFINYD